LHPTARGNVGQLRIYGTIDVVISTTANAGAVADSADDRGVATPIGRKVAMIARFEIVPGARPDVLIALPIRRVDQLSFTCTSPPDESRSSKVGSFNLFGRLSEGPSARTTTFLFWGAGDDKTADERVYRGEDI